MGVPACTAHISLRCFRRRLSYPRPLRWAVATPHRMLAEHPLHAAQAESELGSEVAPSRFCLGAYLAKRSELVADLADQVQDHACQHRRPPVWAASGIHPSIALIGEIGVWRAANGIGPQDLRATGGTQLETLPALWKQRLDRHIAHSTDSSTSARADERRAGHTALSRQRLYQGAERRRSGPSSPGR